MDPGLPGSSTLSAFQGISTTQRLSRISSVQPPFKAFEPYLIRPSVELDDLAAVTACIWSRELQDFESLYSWAALWRGMTLRHPFVEFEHSSFCRTNLAVDDYHCDTKVGSACSSSKTRSSVQNALINSWVFSSSFTPFSSRSRLTQHIPQYCKAFCGHENRYARSCEPFLLANHNIRLGKARISIRISPFYSNYLCYKLVNVLCPTFVVSTNNPAGLPSVVHGPIFRKYHSLLQLGRVSLAILVRYFRGTR
jgi:hypothetical protein